MFNQFLVKTRFWNLVALYCFWFVSFPSYILNWGTLVCCKENCWFCLAWVDRTLSQSPGLPPAKTRELHAIQKSLKTGEHLWWKRTLRICRNVLLKFVISQTILLVPANIAFVTNITVLSTRILLPNYWYESHVFFHQIFFQVCGQKSPFHVVLDLKHIQCLFLAHFVLQAGSMLVRIKHF